MKHSLMILTILAILSLLLTSCATPQVVQQTVVVEKTVEVKETVMVKETVNVPVAVTEAPAEPVTLDMWYFNWPQGYEYQAEHVRLYMQENPHVTVNFDHSIPPVGEGQFEDKVTTSLATGTAPDIFTVINPQAIKLINKGQLSPIDEAALKALGFESLEALKASRVPGAFNSWSDANGTPYSYHWELSWLNLFGNDEQLRACGVDPDTVSINSWQDVIDLGTECVAANPSFYKDASGNWVKNFLKLPMYMDDTWSMQVLTAFLASTGGSVLSEDRTQCTINQPEGVEAVEWMMKVSHELGDPNVGPTIPGDIHTAFGTEEMTMELAGPWMHEAFLVATGSPVVEKGYHAYGMPIVPGGQPGNVFWGWAWAVNPDAANKEEAWKLIRFIEADPQGQAKASGIWQPLPDIEKGWGAGSAPSADKIAAAAEGGQAIFVTEHYAEIARILRGAIEAMAFEKADVQTTLDTASADIQPILDGK